MGVNRVYILYKVVSSMFSCREQIMGVYSDLPYAERKKAKLVQKYETKSKFFRIEDHEVE
jgi:hypothetical protein